MLLHEKTETRYELELENIFVLTNKGFNKEMTFFEYFAFLTKEN
jgi:hypothetical protein